jgi:hypothetical protein
MDFKFVGRPLLAIADEVCPVKMILQDVSLSAVIFKVDSPFNAHHKTCRLGGFNHQNNLI